MDEIVKAAARLTKGSEASAADESSIVASSEVES